jgi:hypothetical protein
MIAGAPRVLALLALTVPAHATCISESLEDMQFYRTAIQQSNAGFERAGLLKSGGGLCGPTCVLNLVKGMEIATGTKILKTADATLEMKRLITSAASKGIDVAERSSPRKLAKILEDQFAAVPKLKAQIKLHRSKVDPGFVLDDIDRPGRATIAAVLWKGSERNTFRGHMLLIRKVDRQQKLLHVMDPNFPNTDLTLTYVEIDVAGQKAYRVKPNYFGPSFGATTGQYYSLDSIITVDVPSLAK